MVFPACQFSLLILTSKGIKNFNYDKEFFNNLTKFYVLTA